MNGVSTITVSEDVALVTFSQIAADSSLIAGIFSDFADAEIIIDMISQTVPAGRHINLSFTLPGNALPKALELIGRMRTARPGLKPMVSSSNCKIQLYGEEMREMRGVAASAVSAIAQANAELLLITTSESDISMLVSRAELPESVKSLEKTFSVTASY